MLNVKVGSLGNLHYLIFFFNEYYNDQDLNIIRKDAINISMGFNLKQNKWGLQMDFYQHIPYYIKVRKVYPQKPADDKTRSYGGGLFHFTMTCFID